ncbi:glutamate racemase [Persicobacter psychrovividus]|uniref:Glutamate racemase n=1 Tax=Persicobacter psychrovividus TaxID=387638 RepID=A0ABN6L716_9BACT|nr:glutamate racemase [Persicobacter psychrovividus]
MEVKNQPIGIFDSGIGGLTVAKAIHETLPQERLVYFGDIAHLPYGDKSTAALQAYAIKICNVLLSMSCKMILIACNSASAAAYDLVKEYVGSKAIVLNVIDPVVDHVAEHFPEQAVGLIGTRQTVNSNVYLKRIDAKNKGIKLQSLATPLLASMIEEGFYNNNISQSVIDKYLADETLQDIRAIILGCTHYPLIKKEVAHFYKNEVEVIDSSYIVADTVKQKLAEANLLRQHKAANSNTFLVSDYTKSFEASSSLFFGESVKLQKYPLWD